MELRSMSRRPPPYTHVGNQRFINSQDDSTTKKENGLNKVRLKAEDDLSPVVIRDEYVKFPRYRYIIYGISGLLMCLICVIMASLMFPYPMHASCIVKWKFEDPCVYTMQKFRCQILNWSSCMNCGPRGSRCLYTLKEPKSYESNVIRAVHLAPNLRTVETIKIYFEEVNKTCVATGESVSNEWFRIFDYGTNYCNLHNLVTGTDFDKKFLELTTSAVCTQYNMVFCE
ncbi:hypothetical protein WH47_01526 [Habropoda laboriosa]|uniref:Uncharacterized protein n=1 Tax=Habropoda laboriosa TaxID=597456 RepID=A0A0L7R0K2_9HYME|nr:PREDICTED: uncharacterized protein LOC108573218 [Habropoda laboriosa]KOC64358.1 hypothetical protein WH47_01526 [Habropoda laboriosa]